MKKSKFVLGALALFTLGLSMNSCLSGDNSQSYSNAYGYVVQDATTSTVGVRTSGNDIITWNNISSSVKAGDCISVSYTVDGTVVNNLSYAQSISVNSVFPSKTLSSGDAISVDANNVVSADNVQMYSANSWFGNNWFVSLTTKSYEGISVTPKFYYSTNLNSFDADTSAVYVDVRLQVSGTATSTTLTTSSPTTYAVNLTPIRTLLSQYTGKTIPIYFRYYPTSKPILSEKTGMKIE